METDVILVVLAVDLVIYLMVVVITLGYGLSLLLLFSAAYAKMTAAYLEMNFNNSSPCLYIVY